jgi:hypothetical protein
LVGTGVKDDKGAKRFENYVNKNRFSSIYCNDSLYFFLNEPLTTGSPFRFVNLRRLLAGEEKKW